MSQHRVDTAAHASRIAAMVCVLLLGACVHVPKRADTAEASSVVCAADAVTAPCTTWIAQWRQQQALTIATPWQWQGRIAVSNNGTGGSARIEWDYEVTHETIVLSAPVTRQSWRLQRDGDTLRLHGVAGGVREGEEALAVLRQAMGWDIPLDVLRHWVQAQAALNEPVEQYRFAAQPPHALTGLQQLGWDVQVQARDENGRAQRIFAQTLNGAQRVRLVIDHWEQ